MGELQTTTKPCPVCHGAFPEMERPYFDPDEIYYHGGCLKPAGDDLKVNGCSICHGAFRRDAKSIVLDGKAVHLECFEKDVAVQE